MADLEVLDELEQDPKPEPQEPTNEPVPDALLEVLVNSRIDALVAAEVEKRLKGVTPKKRTANTQAVDQAAFNKMGYKDRLKLFKSSPVQYAQLIGGQK